LGAVAKDVAAGKAPGGGLEVVVVGSDDAVWRNTQAGTQWVGWKRVGGAAVRVDLAATADALALYTIGSSGELQRATLGSDGQWSGLESLALPAEASEPGTTEPAGPPAGPGTPGTTEPTEPAEPAEPGTTQPVEAAALDSAFGGQAAFQIPSLDVSVGRQLTLGLRFTPDRSQVVITSFAPIKTDSFSTPFGSTNSTVTLVGGGSGTYDASTGRIDIPVTLHFDQSISVPLIEADVDSSLVLSTAAAGGVALDPQSGQLALAADGTFTGSGVNPLAGSAIHLVIAGQISPAP
jgi:hypothetical protein